MSGGNEHQHSPQRTIQQIEDITKWNIEYYIRFMIAHIDWILGGLCSASQPPSHPFLSGIRIIIDWKRALGFSRSTLGGFKRMRQRESESKWKDLKLEMKDWRELKAVTLRFHQRCHTIYFCTYPDATPKGKSHGKQTKYCHSLYTEYVVGRLGGEENQMTFSVCVCVCEWESWRTEGAGERKKEELKGRENQRKIIKIHFAIILWLKR